MNDRKACPMIIDHRSSVPLHHRLGWGCVTAAFWMVWIYLWMPLVTLAAWSFGFYQVHKYIQWEQQVIELRRLLSLYSVVAAAFGGALLLWAMSEYVRFRNKRRRRPSLPVLPDDLARHAGVLAKDIAAWQRLRCVLAYHDAHGGLIGAESFAQLGDERPACRPRG